MNVRELQNVTALNMLTVGLILLLQSFSRNGIFPLERLITVAG
jgi:hypothetical protein